MENHEIIAKMMAYDERARAAEEAAPAHPTSSADRLAEQVAAGRAENARLGVAGKTKKTKQQAAGFRRLKAIEAAYAAAFEAAEDEDGQVEVMVTDEDGFEYPEYHNPKFEDAVAKLIGLGAEAAPYLETLREHHPFDVDEAVDLVAERNQAAITVDYQQRMQKQIAQQSADVEKLRGRIAQLIQLNPQFEPNDPDLLAEMKHLQEQARGTDLLEEKQAFIGQLKALELEQGRRMNAAADAAKLFSSYLDDNPNGTYAEHEDAFIGAMQISDAVYEAQKTAERVTAKYQRDADAQGIGPDSRDKDGRIVIVSPDGKQILSVSDDGAAQAMATGWTTIRDWEATGDPDFIEALNPQPDEYERALAFAEKDNARDHEGEALAAQQAWADEMNQRDAADEAAKAQRVGRNSTGQVLAEMAERLGADPTKDSVPTPDPFAS